MSMLRKVMPAQSTQLADNRTRVIASTNQLARDGHIVEPAGLQTQNFLRVGTILFDHDPKTPVATPVSAEMSPDGLVVDVEWPPDGVSADADKIRGLVKAGVIRAVSIGFEPIDMTPLDPQRPRAGQRISSADLLELSFVSVPADTGAVVAQRSDATDWKCGTSRDLPIDDSDAWDGAAAEASVFEWAGGTDFDPSKARKAFLAYNAAKPKERGSYKLPIAHVVEGRLKVPKGAIRAAASRLPQSDIPDDIKESARKVLDHYEEKADMAQTDNADRGLKIKHTRALQRARLQPSMKRGLYEVASLAYQLEQLGYAHTCAEWETGIEGDDSPVPGMLGDALVKLGEAFIAMSKEEATELLAGKDLEIEEDDIPVQERAHVLNATSHAVRAWRAGIAIARAGKALSATNEKKLQGAQGNHERALKHLKAMGEHHEAAAGHLDAINASQEKAQEQQSKIGDALNDAKADPQNAADHIAKAAKANKTLGGHIADTAETRSAMQDAVADAADSHAAVTRSVKAAQRAVNGVVDGSSPAADPEDGDSKDIQTSAGTAPSDGSAGGRGSDFMMRKAEIARLSVAP